jgi:hypothetical protein
MLHKESDMVDFKALHMYIYIYTHTHLSRPRLNVDLGIRDMTTF